MPSRPAIQLFCGPRKRVRGPEGGLNRDTRRPLFRECGVQDSRFGSIICGVRSGARSVRLT